MKLFYPTILALTLSASAMAQTDELHRAVQLEDTDEVKHYLNRNAKINGYDGDGYTPLMYATDLANPDIIKLLMESGADPNINPQYDSEPPALHTLVLKNLPQMVDLLLQYEITNVDFEDRDKCTALYLAVTNGYLECADVLLFHGANPNALNHRKFTALQAATKFCDTAMVNLLIRHGVDVNQTSDKRNAYSIAAECGCVDVAKILEANNADTKACYPVHYAAAYSNTQMLDHMHDIGLDFNEEAPDEYSPLDIAAMNGQKDNIKLISKYGGKSKTPILLRYISLSAIQEFCKHEYRLGAQIGVHEVRSNSAIYIAFSGRPGYRPALVHESGNLYYQLREKRTFLHATLEKRFSLHHNAFPDCGPYVAYQFAYTGGKFDGAIDMKPHSEMFHVPCVGMYARFRWVGISAGYKYYHYKHAIEAPQNVVNITFTGYIGFSNKNYRKF